MDREITATFIGHKDCFGLDEGRVRAEIIGLIHSGIVQFLNGYMGGFDVLCARLVHELKKDYPYIKNFAVIPYLTHKIDREEYFDEIIYPEGFEKYHFKAAIPKRNKYLVENSCAAVCYVAHDWGGAAKTLEMAYKNNVRVINLAV